jgi:hypothetical protein
MKMKAYLCLLAATFGLLAAQAKAEARVFDFSMQGTDSASLSAPAFALGDRILLTGPDGVSFALEIVSMPPPGIAGQSFIAKDTTTGVGAIVKSREGVVRVTIDDSKQNKIYSFRIKNGVATCTVRTKSTAPDECATCNGVNALNGLNVRWSGYGGGSGGQDHHAPQRHQTDATTPKRHAHSSILIVHS